MTSAAVAPVFANGGEMGARMRAHDWGSTPLGPAETWPQSLKTAVRIMLSSRFAMWMAWGAELTFFCNDAYKPTLGVKEAWALGSRSEAVWSEIWPEIGPRIHRVLNTGEATWDEGLQLFLERRGFPEETYHTFSYSPLVDEAGAITGMLCVVTEETERVIGERRLRVLSDLGARLAHARGADDVWAAVGASLAGENRDLPFTAAYTFDEDGGAHCVAATGLPCGSAAAPERVAPGENGIWPLAKVAASGSAALVEGVADRFTNLATGPGGQPPVAALISPLLTSGPGGASGALVTALNPFRPLDAAYRGFIDLFVSQITAGLASAEAYAAERRRAQALADVDRAKTAFFSNVSHEFRTPLTLMLGPLEEVLDKPDAGVLPDNRRLVAVAHRNGVRLLRLVNTLLDFSRVEAGRVEASFQPVELGAYTADLVSSFRSATDRAGLSLDVACAVGMEPVYVDPEMWEKIVLNLISNAFKFTFEGGIAVTVDQAGGVARLRVRDSGTGIPAAELPRLFERFHRVEGARGRSFEGSGIGLALVQDLVKSHGGAIFVESELGRGTTFTVEVPLGGAHLDAGSIRSEVSVRTPTLGQGFVEEALRWLPDPDEAGSADPDGDLGFRTQDAAPSARIVLADDNADLRAYIARLLRTRGYAVDVFNNGRAALEALNAARPDLLVTDVMMPELDGLALLRAVRAEPALRDLPVVMLSARAGEEAQVEGLEATADDYLTKPFSARELLARVASNLATAKVRRDATLALEESEARFRNMADQAPVMMWVADPSGACTYMNKAWYAFTGFADETALAYGWSDAVDPRDRGRIAQSFRAASGAQADLRMDYRLRRADGAMRWVTAAAARRYAADGAFLGYIGSILDVTEQKETEALLESRVAEEMAARAEAEDALRQAQKMEAVGQLTGGIAHDFNNLLTIISGNIGITGRALDAAGVGDVRARRALANALKGAERAASLTHRLLAFSRRQPLSPKPTDVDRLVSGMSDLLHRALGETIELEVVTSPGLWAVEVDPNQLESALLNLAVNARDAMPDGGRLTIETANARLDETYSAKHAEVAPGHYVVLAVTDTGGGMDKETLARVFEPFFTTKEVGKGTGLGLSMVYGFTKQSGGHVKLYSEPSQGTTVKIYLPRLMSGTELGAPPDAGPDPVPVQRSQTILVVEDDVDVRAYTVDILRELGYRVLEAQDGPAALRLIERRGEAVALMFTDVVMPGMSGSDLVAKARALRPELKVLFTSGYTRNAIVHGGRLDPGVEMIAKPFTFQALAEKVQDVLDRGLTDRILAADPDPASRAALRADLAAAGYAVEEAATAQEALGTVRAAQGRFDAVVLKGASSRSVEKTARELRAMYADLPLLLVVAKGAAELRKRFADDRCVSVISPPMTAADLDKALREVGLRCSTAHA